MLRVCVSLCLICVTSSNPPPLPSAMYSVEIKVERDKVTGETRVLSSNTIFPVDLTHQGVKVYEDERKGDLFGAVKAAVFRRSDLLQVELSSSLCKEPKSTFNQMKRFYWR